MQIKASELNAALGSRYPSAAIHLLDRAYDVRPRREALRSIKRFHRVMKCLGMVKWIASKLDCDKWAWLFKAYSIYLGALRRKSKLAAPVGFMCFYLNGKPYSGHAVTVSAVTVGGKLELLEIDPIPGRGAIELSKVECQSVWLVTI